MRLRVQSSCSEPEPGKRSDIGAGAAGEIALRLGQVSPRRDSLVRVMVCSATCGDSEPMASAQRHFAEARTVVRDRGRLLTDLERAVRATSSPQTFAIFVLGGLDRFRELYGRLEAEALVELAGARLHDLDERARLYRPREGEFALLTATANAEVHDRLTALAEQFSERFEHWGVGAACSAVRLPDEATEARKALALADERLLRHAVERMNRERRSNPPR